MFDWHAALFPAGRSGMRRSTVGAWRTAPAGSLFRILDGDEVRAIVCWRRLRNDLIPLQQVKNLNFAKRIQQIDMSLICK